MNLRHALRHATSALHAELDGRFSALDLGNRRDYTLFLRAQAAALLPLEQRLEQAGVADVVDDWPERSRSRALLADLAALGAASPPPVPVASLQGAGAVFGALYVLEGSRLGAEVLLREHGIGDAGGQLPIHFLGHGRGRRLWPTFLAALELASSAGIADDEVIGGAEAAFRTFLTATELAAA
ncbi:biliverdin-producing heme oxygenase [Chelatococcus reniformis]|uniref:Heme oxygenase n=1 Tax=Chelatococcus reniformis TaxID=1494448 RepID=A0A916X8F3_9HYPH|nr:biliverdin-producing heme oxygenase [Chelatococcus reniformis]GGC49505.1 heme oxygenase [Chelatococcus reniformis]